MTPEERLTSTLPRGFTYADAADDPFARVPTVTYEVPDDHDEYVEQYRREPLVRAFVDEWLERHGGVSRYALDGLYANHGGDALTLDAESLGFGP